MERASSRGSLAKQTPNPAKSQLSVEELTSMYGALSLNQETKEEEEARSLPIKGVEERDEVQSELKKSPQSRRAQFKQMHSGGSASTAQSSSSNKKLLIASQCEMMSPEPTASEQSQPTINVAR